MSNWQNFSHRLYLQLSCWHLLEESLTKFCHQGTIFVSVCKQLWDSSAVYIHAVLDWSLTKFYWALPTKDTLARFLISTDLRITWRNTSVIYQMPFPEYFPNVDLFSKSVVSCCVAAKGVDVRYSEINRHLAKFLHFVLWLLGGDERQPRQLTVLWWIIIYPTFPLCTGRDTFHKGFMSS